MNNNSNSNLINNCSSIQHQMTNNNWCYNIQQQPQNQQMMTTTTGQQSYVKQTNENNLNFNYDQAKMNNSYMDTNSFQEVKTYQDLTTNQIVHANTSQNIETMSAPVPKNISDSNEKIKNAMEDILNNQDNLEHTHRAIPELLKLLKDEDSYVVYQAVQLVKALSMRKAALPLIVNSMEITVSLVQIASQAEYVDHETLKCVLSILYTISVSPEGALRLINISAVSIFIKLIK